MEGWGKLIAGALIGVVGTVYATNEELRKRLPGTARDLPVTVRRRFESALVAAREASSHRRAEILRDLEAHGDAHGGGPVAGGAQTGPDEVGPRREDAARPVPEADRNGSTTENL